MEVIATAPGSATAGSGFGAVSWAAPTVLIVGSIGAVFGFAVDIDELAVALGGLEGRRFLAVDPEPETCCGADNAISASTTHNALFIFRSPGGRLERLIALFAHESARSVRGLG